MVTRHGFVWCAVLFLVASRAEAQRLAFAPPEQDELVLFRELARPTSFRFKEMPLTGVCQVIFQRHGFLPVIDRRALDEIGIDRDTPISISVSNVALEHALDYLLQSVDPSLTWAVENGMLVITTRDWDEQRQQTWVYDVTPLIEETFDEQYGPDFDQLIETITSTVKPDSWDEVGGPGSITPFETNGKYALVVSQRYDVHRKLDRFIRSLYRLAGREVPQVRRSSSTTRGSFVRARAAGDRPRNAGHFGGSGIHNPRGLPMTKDPKADQGFSPGFGINAPKDRGFF